MEVPVIISPEWVVEKPGLPKTPGEKQQEFNNARENAVKSPEWQQALPKEQAKTKNLVIAEVNMARMASVGRGWLNESKNTIPKFNVQDLWKLSYNENTQVSVYLAGLDWWISFTDMPVTLKDTIKNILKNAWFDNKVSFSKDPVWNLVITDLNSGWRESVKINNFWKIEKVIRT